MVSNHASYINIHEYVPYKPDYKAMALKAWNSVKERYDTKRNKLINISEYYKKLSEIKDIKYTDTLSYKYLIKHPTNNMYVLTDRYLGRGSTRKDYEDLCKEYSGRISVQFSNEVSLREFSIDKEHVGFLLENKSCALSDYPAQEARRNLLLALIQEIHFVFKLSTKEILITQALIGYSEHDIEGYPKDTIDNIIEFIEDVHNEIVVWRDVNKDLRQYYKDSIASESVKAFITLIGDRL